MRMSLRWLLVATAVLAALVGTYFFGRTASFAKQHGEITNAASSSEAAVPDGSLDDGKAWNVTTSKDPMTDAIIHQASATIEGNQFDAEVNVTCSSTGGITYTATSFDKGHQPAPMRSRTVPFGYTAGVYVDYQMRPDDQPAKDLTSANPPYNNQIILTTPPVQPLYDDGSGIDDAEQVASASHVLLRIFLTTGEELFDLPQADSGFRSVVAPCLAQRRHERAQLTAQQKESQSLPETLPLSK